MLRCISAEYPPNLSFVKKPTRLYERQRLLLQMLSRRDALRVVCAPSQYGKTVLAYQYATSVFAAENTAWVNASDLSFLLALDAPISTEFTARYLESTAPRTLFVFDGCPHLSEKRFAALVDLIEKLLEAAHEVLLTTTDSRWVKLTGVPLLALNACELLLDSDEQARWPQSTRAITGIDAEEADERDEPSHASKPKDGTLEEACFDLGRIPGFRQAADHPREAFLHSLVNAEVKCEQDALAHLALLLGSGALHELTTFAQAFASNTILHLEQHYPHCGVKRLDPMFQAATLSSDQKFALVQHHLTALTEALPAFSEEDELVTALIECLLRRGEKLFAMQLVCGLHDNDRKAAYFDRHARDFLLDSQPLALLKLAAALPRSFYSTLERWQLVIIALGLVNDGKHAELALDAFQQQYCGIAATASPADAAAAELFCVLARIVFETEMEHDPANLLPCVRARADQMTLAGEFGAPAASQLSYTRDVLSLIEQALIDPHKAVETLERIGATGYTIKESLGAVALFVQLLIHFWSARLFEVQELDAAATAMPELHAIPAKGRTRKEAELLTRLESHITQLLARQESILAPNSYELFLFEKAYHLYGDRVYLLVSDGLLERIEVGKQSLIAQRKQWRTYQASNATEYARPHKASDKKPEKVLRINTLGRFEIESRDPSVTIQAKVRKQLRVLISLLAINEGREVSRPWIQRVMWPEAAERNAKQNLYSMWSLLNKSITNAAGECPFFESFPQSIALNEQLVETDVRLLVDLCKRLRNEDLEPNEYESILDELEDIYRGPLLPGLETAEVVAHRKRYQDHLVEALIQSGLHLRKHGNTALALRYFRFAFDNEPTREDVCYQVMMALWKLGRHGEALNEYFVCRRALIDEYGVEGTTRLRELYESILSDAS